LSKYAKLRCLLSDAGNSSLSLPFFEFKAVQKQLLAPMSILIYGDKIALIAANGMNFSFLVVSSIELVQNGLKRFEENWKTALPFTVQANTKKLRSQNAESPHQAPSNRENSRERELQIDS